MKKLLVSIVSICVVLCGILRIESQAGIIPTLSSSSWSRFTMFGAEYVRFAFQFEIEAVDEDVYVAHVGVDSNLFTTSGYTYLGCFFGDTPEAVGEFGQTYYRILEGHTAVFTYEPFVRPSTDMFVYVDINSIYWNDTPSTESGSPESWNGEVQSTTWASDRVFINGSVPEPTSTLLALVGGLGLASRRRRS